MHTVATLGRQRGNARKCNGSQRETPGQSAAIARTGQEILGLTSVKQLVRELSFHSYCVLTPQAP